MRSEVIKFLEVKRKEYEYADKHNLKALKEVIRVCVKKTIKNNQIKLVPGEQQTLF